MTTTIYEPGDWLGIVTPAAIALLPGDTSADLTGVLREVLRAGRGFGGLLDVLTGTLGTSLASFPSFALVAFSEGEIRVAVRGPLAVEIDHDRAESADVIRGIGVTTWNERHFARVSTVSLALVDGLAASPVRLVIDDGVVLSARVERVFVESPNDQAAPAPRPVVAQPVDIESVAVEPDPVDDGATRVPDVEPEPIETVGKDYDQLWGATVATSVESAAVRETEIATDHIATDHTATDHDHDHDHADGAAADPRASPAPVPARSQAPVSTPGTPVPVISGVPGFSPSGPAAAPRVDTSPAGDHDGRTVSLAGLRRLQESAPEVVAVRPVAGSLSLSTGQRVDVDRTIVIGRKPRATRVTGDEIPHLITVPSPEQDISRSHVQFHPEGTKVLVEDLGTTNGTVLRRPGEAPLRLHPSEGVMLAPGDVIDLGEGVTVEYRVIA